MASFIEGLQAKQQARESYDFQPRPPLPGTLEAVKLLVALLEEFHNCVPSRVLNQRARELKLSRFHLNEAKALLRLKAQRVQREKASHSGHWLTCATPDTPRAVEDLMTPKAEIIEPEDLTETETLLLYLKGLLDSGKLRNKTVRLEGRTIPNAEITVRLFFSLHNPKPEFIQQATELARKLQEKK